MLHVIKKKQDKASKTNFLQITASALAVKSL